MPKPGWIALTVVFAAVVGWSLYRDIHIEQQYPYDLRNRITGARLEADHASPYFYTWRPGDTIRYYDPSNMDAPENPSHLSNITGTPFFHHLLTPIAGLPQRTISRIWLFIEYLLLAICTGIGLALARNRSQKAMVLVTIALFLLTEAWKQHIRAGQIYLFIPTLALLFYSLVRNQRHVLYGAAAGLCAITLVMIRPNALLFFLPFLLVMGKYPVRYITSFLLPVVLLAGGSLALPQERALWQDYTTFIDRQIKMHQSDVAPVLRPLPKPAYSNWEGWEQQAIDESTALHPFTPHSEHGNVFVVFEKLFHRKTNLTMLNTACVAVLICLTGLFIYRRSGQAGNDDLLSLALLGYCLYMVSDLFSPVWRHQYYAVQWLCPLLLAAAAYAPRQKWMYALLALGLLLNILNLSFMKMEHTIGEYLMLVMLVSYSLRPRGSDGRLHTSSNNTDRSNR